LQILQKKAGWGGILGRPFFVALLKGKALADHPEKGLCEWVDEPSQ
jgi:hypothetical protein